MKKNVLYEFIAVVVSVIMIGMYLPVINANAEEVTVYITKTGEKYHSDGCSSLRKSKIAVSLDYATSHGYTPCSKCHPATAVSSSSVKPSSTVSANSTSVNSTTTKSESVAASSSSSTMDLSKFDAVYYATKYQDVAKAFGTDANSLYTHYVNYGMKEGRFPNALAEALGVQGVMATLTGVPSWFDAAYYANKYPDVVAVYHSSDAAILYNHYITYGQKEGRFPSKTAESGK